MTLPIQNKNNRKKMFKPSLHKYDLMINVLQPNYNMNKSLETIYEATILDV